MKILDLKQNTPEWKDFRWDHIGASDCPAIMAGGERAATLMRQKAKHEDAYVTDAMRHGSKMEPLTRDLYNARSGTNFEDVVGQSDEHPWMFASFDGYDANLPYLLEIKHPQWESFVKIKRTGVPPKDWQWQCQHQLAVARDKMHVLLLIRLKKEDIGVDEELQFVVERDQAMIDMLIEAEEAFYKNLLRFNVPAAKEVVEQHDLEEELALMAAAKEAEREAKERYEALKEKVLAKIDGGADKVIAGSYAFIRVVRPGAVDYGSIPLLKGMDLDPYRREPVVSWTLRSL